MILARNFRAPDAIVPVYPWASPFYTQFTPAALDGLEDPIVPASILYTMADAYSPKNTTTIEFANNMFMSPGTGTTDEIYKIYPYTHFVVAQTDTLRDMSFIFM